MLIVTIPGFHGLQADFSPLKSQIQALATQRGQPIEIWGPEIFTPDADFPPTDFEGWTRRLFAHIQNIRAGRKVSVIGYSLGARLALHLISLNSEVDLWDRCLLLAGHPGVTNPTAISQRHKFDQLWHQRFLNEPWHSLQEAWNGLGIFAHDPGATRNETEFSREYLAQAFTVFSPTQHICDLENFVHACPNRIGVVGELDKKYHEIYTMLTETGTLTQLLVVGNSGHRILLSKKHLDLAEITFSTKELNAQSNQGN